MSESRRLTLFITAIAPLPLIVHAAGILFAYFALAVLLIAVAIYVPNFKGELTKSFKRFIGNSWLLISISLLAISSLISLTRSDPELKASVHLFVIWLVVGMAFLFYVALKSLPLKKLLKNYMVALFIVAGVVLVVCLFVTKDSVDFSSETVKHYLLRYSYVSVFFVPVILLFLFEEKGSPNYKLYFMMAIVSLIFVILVAGLLERRTVFLAIIAMIAMFFIKYISKVKLRYILLALGLFIAFCWLIFLIFFKSKMLILSNYGSGIFLPYWLVDIQRQSIWYYSFKLLPDTGLFGYGIDMSNKIYDGSSTSYFIEGFAKIFSSPHNIVLELLIDMGWFGTAAFISAVLAFSWRSIFGKNNFQFCELLLHVGFFTGFMVNFSLWGHNWLWAAYLFAVAFVRALDRGDKTAPIKADKS